MSHQTTSEKSQKLPEPKIDGLDIDPSTSVSRWQGALNIQNDAAAISPLRPILDSLTVARENPDWKINVTYNDITAHLPALSAVGEDGYNTDVVSTILTRHVEPALFVDYEDCMLFVSAYSMMSSIMTGFLQTPSIPISRQQAEALPNAIGVYNDSRFDFLRTKFLIDRFTLSSIAEVARKMLE